ncbi:MAG: hypothetical protein EOP84_23900 [Verrucomicrobiaceae bacterium]|nr:MAG: hypothetical protein EOP84_23900 [Verrucomicrobiaceae bacterium]
MIPSWRVPDAAARKSHSHVLAQGEATGHAHRLAKTEAGEVFTVDGQMFIDVIEESATIVHEEHGPITLPRGCYEVRIQREYTPQGIRRVYD